MPRNEDWGKDRLVELLSILGAAGRHEELKDAIDEVVASTMVYIAALAYLIDKSPREALDMMFKAAPTTEKWLVMVKEIEDLMDRI